MRWRWLSGSAWGPSRWLFVLAASSLCLSGAGAVRAEGMRSVVSPGPVIAGHADVEAQCEKCHAAFDKAAQNPLCLSCHEEIAADVKAGTGAHGRTFLRNRTNCRDCHTDHRGRKFDIVALDPAVFRHEWTDYALTGAHLAVKCTGCHPADVRYAAAPSQCAACHEADDAHHGGLGETCGNCHKTRSWKNGRFDHSTTSFALRGAHKAASCASCHPSERYADTPSRCVDCHRVDDAHDGARGERCQDCHGESEWKKTLFDHEKTDFPLRARHIAVPCAECHGSDVHAPLELTCVSCHTRDDVHRGEQGERCESCHDEKGWSEEVRFDHDLARFPLTGMHSVAACEACHEDSRYRETPRECVACHRSDDVHERKLGERCVDCHSPEGWSRWEFDHGARTRFALDGAHAGIDCRACHIEPGEKVTNPRMQCAACHEADDVHAGAFGPSCERCHDTTSFIAVIKPAH